MAGSLKLSLSPHGSEASVIARPSWGGIADRARLRIGYAVLCQAVPDCGSAAMAASLREGLGKVADVVDICGASKDQAAACDAVLAMDCASRMPEPYFIYLCPEQGNLPFTDRGVYERAAGLFAENSRMAHCLAEGVGISRQKIHVIPPAVPGWQNSPSIPPPDLHGVPRRRHMLLRISDAREQCLRLESVCRVLDALEILRVEHDPGISLTISGLEDWPLAGSLPDGVSLSAPVSDGEAIGLLDSHDLLLLPPGIEFVGLPEALSRGVPCVAASTSELSEAITPAVTGVLIDGSDARELAEAVASVLADDELYHECYRRAPAMAAYFSWERVARQVAHVISREVGITALLGPPGAGKSHPRCSSCDPGKHPLAGQRRRRVRRSDEGWIRRHKSAAGLAGVPSTSV